jgi:hypothetical protein
MLFEKLRGRSAWQADRTECHGSDSSCALYFQLSNSILHSATASVGRVSWGLFMYECIKVLETYLKTVYDHYLAKHRRDAAFYYDACV